MGPIQLQTTRNLRQSAFLIGRYSSPCGSSQIRMALVRRKKGWAVEGQRQDQWSVPRFCQRVPSRTRAPGDPTYDALIMVGR